MPLIKMGLTLKQCVMTKSAFNYGTNVGRGQWIMTMIIAGMCRNGLRM